MNGKKARQIRKVVYGKEFSPRARSYKRLANGQMIAGKKRQAYQKTKRDLSKINPETLRE